MIRLGASEVNGLYGCIEVCDNGTLRAVCDKGWGIEDAQVLCRQFGYEGNILME